MGRGTHPYPSLPHPDPILIPSIRSCSLHYYRPTLTYILVALGGLLLATLCWTREISGDANGPMLLPFLDEHGEIQQFSIIIIVLNYFLENYIGDFTS